MFRTRRLGLYTLRLKDSLCLNSSATFVLPPPQHSNTPVRIFDSPARSEHRILPSFDGAQPNLTGPHHLSLLNPSVLGPPATTATTSLVENTAMPWSIEPPAAFSERIHRLSAYRKTCVFYSTPFSSPGQAPPFRFRIPTRPPLTHR